MDLLLLGGAALIVYALMSSGPAGVPASSADLESLARMITSEAGGQTVAEKTAIAYSALNHARADGLSFADASNGNGPQGGSRPWSTSQNATAADRILATQILAAYPGNDPTHGATAFFEPAAQDQLYAAGHAGYNYDAQGIRDRWTSGGQALVAVVGRWEFYG